MTNIAFTILSLTRSVFLSLTSDKMSVSQTFEKKLWPRWPNIYVFFKLFSSKATYSFVLCVYLSFAQLTLGSDMTYLIYDIPVIRFRVQGIKNRQYVNEIKYKKRSIHMAYNVKLSLATCHLSGQHAHSFELDEELEISWSSLWLWLWIMSVRWTELLLNCVLSTNLTSGQVVTCLKC